jgi:hypothetical protein
MNQRSKTFTFRANFEEVNILEAKKKQLKSKAGIGTLAKNLALTRNLPKNDNDIEFLELMNFVFKEFKKLGGEIDNVSSSQVEQSYLRIVEKYEETLYKIIE